MAGFTQSILDAVLARLAAQVPDIGREYFPDDPDTYRVNHPVGMFLVSYAGGRFGPSVDVAAVIQERGLRVTVTTVFRQLNGRMGAVDALDLQRLALVGFQPIGCTHKMRAVEEKFLSRQSGLWYYATAYELGAMQIEDTEEEAGPPARNIEFQSGA